jgi:GntR family transcriptional regulator
MFILNPHSSVPIYQQLVEQVRRMVAGGQLAPGTELPSVRELAQEHTVHPMTISKAYSLLEAEGLLERNRGRPMTVSGQARSATPLTKRLQQIQPLVAHTVLAAKQLELSEAELVKSVRKHWENGNE